MAQGDGLKVGSRFVQRNQIDGSLGTATTAASRWFAFAPGTVTGAASVTLGTATTTATGVRMVRGSASAALGSLGIAATSVDTVVGSAVVTPGTLAITAASLRTTFASASVTLSDLVITAGAAPPPVASSPSSAPLVLGAMRSVIAAAEKWAQRPKPRTIAGRASLRLADLTVLAKGTLVWTIPAVEKASTLTIAERNHLAVLYSLHPALATGFSLSKALAASEPPEPSDPEDQLRSGALLWALAREGISLKGVPPAVVVEIGDRLAEAMAAGDSTQTTSELIAPLLGGDLKRAELIARTETARATEGAVYQYAKETGGLDKAWLDDEIACPICRANAAQGSIPITRPFQGGVLFPPQHPNCRCALALTEKH